MRELLAVLPDWLGVYLLIVNVAAFAVYGADKLRARQGRWRVPEKTLFLLAIIGGSVGALLGMWCFHHKTRHWYFRYGIPVILVVQLALACWLWLRCTSIRRTIKEPHCEVSQCGSSALS